jgi:hypothetical protein
MLGELFFGFVEADAAILEPATRATVVGYDLGDDGQGLGLVGDGAEDKVYLDIERRQAPEWAPPAGDGLGAGAVVGGEKGDDGSEDVVGKFADSIVVVVAEEISAAALIWWPTPGGSIGYRNRRRLLLLLLPAIFLHVHGCRDGEVGMELGNSTALDPSSNTGTVMEMQ